MAPYTKTITVAEYMALDPGGPFSIKYGFIGWHTWYTLDLFERDIRMNKTRATIRWIRNQRYRVRESK